MHFLLALESIFYLMFTSCEIVISWAMLQLHIEHKRRGTPIFSFETPSRRSNLSNRLRGPTARELLNIIAPSGETLGEHTTWVTPPASNSASVSTENNYERRPHREAQWVISDLLKWINASLYRDTLVINAIKHLREHQKKLQASPFRIKEMLKQLTEAQKVNEKYERNTFLKCLV